MSSARRGWVICTCLFVVVLLPAGIAAAAEVADKTSTALKPEQRMERIKAALDDHTSIEFVETPLQDVVDYLKDFHNIEIQVDSKSLEENSVGTDARISRNLKNITLRSALRSLLGRLDLTYVVQDEVLLITTPQAAQELKSARVYDVASMLAAGQSAEVLAEVIRNAVRTTPPSDCVVTVQVKGAQKAAHSDHVSGGAAPPAHEEVTSIAAFRNVLIVRATYRGHESIDDLLGDLRSKLQKTVAAAPAASEPAERK